MHLKQIKKEQVHVKPNFVEAAKEIVLYKNRKNQFIYVGRLEKIKGIDILLEAWKVLGDEAPELLMCGKGPLEARAKEYVDNRLHS